VYYLHNDVKTIEKCAADLAELVPEARIGIGHGQMRERELEQVMSDFYHKRFNVLIASTIIETGIDVPSANTIIIERADKFGLAQLHQLRGRVGRSHHQAYAYLLTPPRQQITPDAEKRLEAIANTQDLGAGFVLATNDLEIRGAGELLGDGQSGRSRRWASPCTWKCSSARSRRSARANSRTWSNRWAAARRSTCGCRR
jgi:transcription-repair coupling factor (superfamily II helicase)